MSDRQQEIAKRLALEACTGAVAAFSIAPIVTIVDKAITTNASGVEPLIPAIKNGFKSFLTRPGQFVRTPAFLWIWAVFSGTYATANCIEAFCEMNYTPAFYPKFIGSSIVNVTLSVSKDRAYARMFGKGTPRPTPAKTLALFGIRDGMTILASFCLPPIVSTKLQEDFGMKKSTADTTAQLVSPLAVQILSCPLHLLGLDLYNRPVASGAERKSLIFNEYGKTLMARWSRILPAFGIGGLVNTKLRAAVKAASRIELDDKLIAR